MILIIFLALMANSALLSDACDLGPPKLNNFKWSKFIDDGPWYYLLHESNAFENNLDCPTAAFASPECNVSLLTTGAYVAQNSVEYSAFSRNWNKTGYFEVIHTPEIWTGKYRVLAIDYDRYHILKHCPFFQDEPVYYVAFRDSSPDILTWLRVLKKLLENKIDIRKLVKWCTNNGQ